MNSIISISPIEIRELRPANFGEYAIFWIVAYAESRKAPSSLHRDKGILKNYLVPAFGKLKLEQISALYVDVWFSALQTSGGISVKSCNDVLGLLKKMLNDAERWGMIDRNPILAIRKFRLPEMDFHFWNVSEVRQFLGFWNQKVDPPRIYSVVIIALYTGLRRGEILGLKWDAVSFESRFITVKRSYCRTLNALVDTTKSRRIRRVPINAMLMAHLEKMKILTFRSGYVCPPIHPDCVHKEFKKISRFAGVPIIRFHDLRHTFASNFLMGGGNIYDLQKILGHSTVQVTERYTHLIPEHLQGKTEVLGF